MPIFVQNCDFKIQAKLSVRTALFWCIFFAASKVNSDRKIFSGIIEMLQL